MEHESGTENTVPKLLDQAELLMQDFVEFQKQLILNKTMILNFDQLNNQLYLLEKEFQEFIILAAKVNIEPNEELSYDFIVRTIRLYTYTIRDCRKSLDGEEGFIHLEHFKPPEE
jgi:hypothetical protein